MRPWPPTQSPRLEGISIDDLPPGDLRILYLVFYRFLRGELDALYLNQTELTAALQALGHEHRRRWAILIYRNLPALCQSIDLTREDLQNLLEEHGQLRKAMDEAHSRLLKRIDELAVEPPLEFTLLVPNKSIRFTYRAQHVQLFGREQEMEELRAFLKPASADAVDFRWWLWIGPGGSGKSRLAWELCLEAESDGWKVGFLDDNAPFHDWHRWVVDRPTLVIIDYVAKRAQQALAAILGLIQHPENIRKPVRILLLERSIDPQSDAWWSRFAQRDSDTKTDQLRHFVHWAYDGEDKPHDLTRCSRCLEPLDATALGSIIAAICSETAKSHTPQQLDSVVKVLEGIDPQGRPLFAMLAAEALREHGLEGIRHWDAATLIEQILAREFAIWRKVCGVADGASTEFEQHLNLLTFVTICGAQAFAIVDRLHQRGQNVPAGADHVNLAWWRSFLGYSADPERDRLVPLAPDILGEMYVLQRLNPDGTLNAAKNPRVTPPRDTKELLQHAWASFPLATATFLWRSVNDFPDVPLTQRRALLPTSALPSPLEEAGFSAENQATSWLFVGLVHSTTFGDHVAALDAFDHAIQLRPDDPVAHNNRGVVLSDLERYEKALGAYDRAIQLRPDFPEAHNNRGNALTNLGRHEEALDAFDHANKLQPDDSDTYYNRGTALSDMGRHEEAPAPTTMPSEFGPITPWPTTTGETP